MRIEEKNGVVVLIDALGTRHKSMLGCPEELFESLSKVIDFTEDVIRSPQITKSVQEIISSMVILDSDTQTQPTVDTVNKKLYSFSDTLILTFYEKQMILNLIEAAIATSIILIKGINIGMAYRGALSCGTFCTNENSKYTQIIGAAMNEAAYWYEKSEWLGVHCTPSAMGRLMLYYKKRLQPPRNSLLNYFIMHEIPLKNHKTLNTWALNWPVYIHSFRQEVLEVNYHTDDEKETNGLFDWSLSGMMKEREWLENQMSNISKIGNQTSNKQKFDNTMIFFDHIVEVFKGFQQRRHDELERREKGSGK